jgi:hypothetical protein
MSPDRREHIIVQCFVPDLDKVAPWHGTLQVVRSIEGDEPSAVHEGQPVTELLGLVHVVGGKDDRGLFRVQHRDLFPDLAAGFGVEPDGGLIKEQDERVVEKGPDDLELPAHPT